MQQSEFTEAYEATSCVGIADSFGCGMGGSGPSAEQRLRAGISPVAESGEKTGPENAQGIQEASQVKEEGGEGEPEAVAST